METRVEKYKNYRSSLVKENKSVSTEKENVFKTATLPINEVMNKTNGVNTSADYYKKSRKEKIIKYSFYLVVLLLVIVGVIFLGIYAFKGA